MTDVTKHESIKVRVFDYKESLLSEDPVGTKDYVYLFILVVYLGIVFYFSALFYLATEDYEAVVAVRLIDEGYLIGKSTGWPHTPLAAYLFYVWSILFGETIQGFRIFTGFLMLASVLPIYLVLRSLCGPFVSFALTLFSFSLCTFPHPRLEYFIEGSFAAFGIFFAVRYLHRTVRIYLYLSALFSLAAFTSKGYPASAIMLLVIPLALTVVRQVLHWTPGLRKYFRYYQISLNAWLRNSKANVPIVLKLPRIGFVFLGLFCTIFLFRFLKKTVHRTALFEYADINDLVNFPSMLFKLSLSWLLLLIFGGSYLAANLRRGSEKRAYATVTLGAGFLRRSFGNALPIFFPFLLFGLLFLFIAALAGYRSEDLIFFVFPVEIFIDHVGQITKQTAVVPLFMVLLATTLYFYLSKSVDLQKAITSIFLLLLIPSTFVRFFPTYNMLYLGSFLVAIFVSIILPKLAEFVFSKEISVRLQNSIAIFLIVYSIGANFFLLARTQFSDWRKGSVVMIEKDVFKGIYIERDVVDYFKEVHRVLGRMSSGNQNIAFLSNRYLNYVPLIYDYTDVLAGQNLMNGLGKLWSYEDVHKVDGFRSENTLSKENMIYSWRKAAIDKIERSSTKIIVMSLYDREVSGRKAGPSSDPFRKYLWENFILGEVVEPNMKIHRRSSSSEGAVIFVRKR